MFFATNSDLKTYLPIIAADFTPADLASDIAEVDAQIIELISQNQFDELKTDWEAETLTVEQEKLLHFVRTIEANLGYAKYQKIGNLKISSTGTFRKETENEPTPYRYQTDTANERFLEKGYNAIEMMLAFLEQNEADYPLWTASNAYTQYKNLLIRNATEFDEYVNINHSRRIFLRMKNILKETETFEIKKFIGKSLYDAIKSDLENVLYAEILSFLKAALAHFSWAKALRILPLNPTSQGYFSLEFTGEQANSEKKQTPLPFVQTAIDDNLMMGKAYLQEAADYLNMNISDFPSFTESAAYIAPELPLAERNKDTDSLFYL